MANERVALIAGVGEGLGLATARRFASAGFKAALMARNEEKLHRLVAVIQRLGGAAVAVPVDVRHEAELQSAFKWLEITHGPIEVAVYNAGNQYRQPFLDMSAETFENAWRVLCLGGFLVGREAAWRMISRGRGTIIFTGATASLRGGPEFAAFASGKFALRALAQSMARELGPKGIHIAHVVIDGFIDTPTIRHLYPQIVQQFPEDGMLSPEAIAQTYFQLYEQERSAWSFEVDLRPYAEKF